MHEPWHDFSRALSGDPGPAIPLLRAIGGVPAENRFEIHRRNRRHALADALRARFPVTAALVGDEFFSALAIEYVRRHPPRSPALFRYGADFAEFIERGPAADDVACLPDVARLEHAWQEAFNAREAPALQLASLAALHPEAMLQARFEPHPATRLVASLHPVATLWNAHGQARTSAPLDRYDAECALVTRPDADVRVDALPLAARSFLEPLLAGAAFEIAATAVGDDADPVALLRHLIEIGAFTRILTSLSEHTSC